MGIDHIFDAIGNQLARWQRIKHAVMAHRDAVIDRDGIEFLGYTARFLDFARDKLAKILQMHMAWHELGEGIDDRNDRLAEILVFHTGRAPKAAGTCHVAAMRGSAGAINGHFELPETDDNDC